MVQRRRRMEQPLKTCRLDQLSSVNRRTCSSHSIRFKCVENRSHAFDPSGKGTPSNVVHDDTISLRCRQCSPTLTNHPSSHACDPLDTVSQTRSPSRLVSIHECHEFVLKASESCETTEMVSGRKDHPFLLNLEQIMIGG